MSNKRSPGSFCSVVVLTTTGTSNSITSLPVAGLGNGAVAYCLANAALYRYVSTSAQATLGDTFLVPLSGGGCWVKQSAQGDYTQQVTGTTGGFQGSSINIGSGTGIWRALPSVASAYTASFSQTMWSLNTTTGILTYHGPSGLKFLVSATLSFSTDSGGEPMACEMTLAANGELIGTGGDDPAAVSTTLNGNLSSTVSPGEFTQNFVVNSADAGDTYQHIVRRVTDFLSSFLMDRYRVAIAQV